MLNSRRQTLVALAAPAVAMLMPSSASGQSLRDQVWEAEIAFARTMAERNIRKFEEFISEEAIFFAGTTALTGKKRVIESWSSSFIGPVAPFSWEPDQVEVLSSGTLAMSTGPVRDSTGKVIARFNTIWRLESDNKWLVVFDKGSPPSAGPQ